MYAEALSKQICTDASAAVSDATRYTEVVPLLTECTPRGMSSGSVH